MLLNFKIICSGTRVPKSKYFDKSIVLHKIKSGTRLHLMLLPCTILFVESFECTSMELRTWSNTEVTLVKISKEIVHVH